ncbi:MAG TPA: hypothetical protein VFU47_11465 [Armatimonadota bacterium]|nr:hypothetical protein [Armatimonadota bacterium]
MRAWPLFAAALILAPAAGRAFQEDPATAAINTKEPSLGEIARRLGYTLDVGVEEVNAQRFVRAGAGPVKHEVLASWGLEKPCHGGWYRPGDGPVKKETLWTVNQKKDLPSLEPGSRTEFDPGAGEFGLFVNTEGFPEEIVTTEDAKLEYVPRFKPGDKHKAHVYVARKDGKTVPNTYLIGWEYSTNNDNQDIVTLVSNVKPVPGGAYRPK